ncbi:aromatic ring-hydroxylating dioxygenase subunit alpha [Marinobacter sp. chi1]|uniref:Aromatic ring-hydroxylating dioxygenase subunit alpha n=1 Tax=Marinobacter suaedae TaxID=3057675 RepID=A0ABT8VX11_9GAMM|nr:aromatic ring-hydroxylating dioxygenase subunit alpha [Marinobacter sp. chi1]MDO3720528.1 aromatic ring-hydroxylating dioxygenase subunit alpha [Marinobacter sp. chi1]
MNRHDETRILKQCLNLLADKSTTLSAETHTSPVERYTDPQRFEQERHAIHQALPVAYLHSSELPNPNDFRTVATHSGNVLFTRTEAGEVKAFHNVCRHRGAQVESRASGCAKAFSCPYHAWRYGNDGQLLSAPFEQTCFPELDKSQSGLAPIPCVEAYGFIWLCPTAKNDDDAEKQLEAHLEPVKADLEWLQCDGLHKFETHRRTWKANWKIVTEGGLETYHFKFAHKNTIGPYFLSNTCVTDQLGAHFRVVMPTEELKSVTKDLIQDVRLRDIAHVVYSIAPQMVLLVQKNHIDWIQTVPISVDQSEIFITPLIPKPVEDLTEKELDYWQRNREISLNTLDEDFELGEQIQAGMASGANSKLTFGRNEGALATFNAWVEERLNSS